MRLRAHLRALPIELVVLGVGAGLLRLPTVVSRGVLNPDDSVYLASVGAMRDGGLPFRDVFSSQGPAFLPLLWLADLAGGRVVWAPRLLPLLAGGALVVTTYALGRRVGSRAGAGLAAFLVSISGAVAFVTERLESDGVAAAFAAGAVLAAAAARTRRGDAVTALLIGLAVAVKSLFVAPAALAVLYLVWRRRGSRVAMAVTLGAVATVLIVALPWGLGAVWEQSVAFHLRASGSWDLGANLRLVQRSLWRTDRILLVVSVAGGVSVAIRRLLSTPPPPATTPDRSDLATAAWIWLAAALVVAMTHDPLLFQQLVLLVPPIAVLTARYRPPLVVAAALVLLLLPGHARRAGWATTSPQLLPSEAAAVELLRRIEPVDGRVISDEGAIVRLAERSSPGSVVDVSFVRIAAGDLTTADVVRAAGEDRVCAVLLWSGRLDQLPGLRPALLEYRSVSREGDHELLLREGCHLDR